MSGYGDGKDFIEGEYTIVDERDAEDVYQYPQSNRYIELNSSRPYITYTILGLNIAVWLLMGLAGLLFNLSTGQQLLIFGAKENTLVALGQYWRLFTAMFLHIGAVHLFFNSYALHIYGPIVEKLFGKGRFLTIYLISGLMGSLFSYLFSPNPAAGASGAIFGLMGALLYFRQREKDLYKRVFGTGLFMIIGINLFYGFVQPGIDNWGHIGGLVGGYLIANALGLYKEKRISIKKLLIGALIVLAFFFGLRYGQQKYIYKADKIAIQTVFTGGDWQWLRFL